MPLTITFNTHDAEALEAIVGPCPESLAEQWKRADDIAPGTCRLDLDEHTRTVDVHQFDPLAAGIILGRYAQTDDRVALQSWFTDEVDFTSEAYLNCIGAPDEVVRQTAQTYAMMVELTKAIEDGSVEVIQVDLSDDALDHAVEDFEHPAEHGGEA